MNNNEKSALLSVIEIIPGNVHGLTNFGYITVLEITMIYNAIKTPIKKNGSISYLSAGSRILTFVKGTIYRWLDWKEKQ